MRYYVISDVHGFLHEMEKALSDAGYDDSPDKKLVVLGDCWDRGPDPYGVYLFLKPRIASKQAIMIKGNHEYLMNELLQRGYPQLYDYSNGTCDTVNTLIDSGQMSRDDVLKWVNGRFWKNYCEIGDYVFVHGWVPLRGFSIAEYEGADSYEGLTVVPNWRLCKDPITWEEASWVGGPLALKAGLTVPGKTIVCGHWHASAFHSAFERKVKSEFGPDADFSIFRGNGCIAIDACTAFTHNVNVLVLDIADKAKRGKGK